MLTLGALAGLTASAAWICVSFSPSTGSPSMLTNTSPTCTCRGDKIPNRNYYRQCLFGSPLRWVKTASMAGLIQTDLEVTGLDRWSFCYIRDSIWWVRVDRKSNSSNSLNGLSDSKKGEMTLIFHRKILRAALKPFVDTCSRCYACRGTDQIHRVRPSPIACNAANQLYNAKNNAQSSRIQYETKIKQISR